MVFGYSIIGFKIHRGCVSETVRVQQGTIVCEIQTEGTLQQAVAECRAVDHGAYTAAP